MITTVARAQTMATLDHLKISDRVDGLVTPDDPPAPKPSFVNLSDREPGPLTRRK